MVTKSAGQKLSDRLIPYLYIFPIVVLSLLVIYYCIGFTLASSFTDWDGMSRSMRFTGLDNYIRLFQDRTFFTALRNNLVFFAGTIFPQAVLGLLLAVLLKQKLPGNNIFKAIFFLPISMAPAIIAAIFRIILNPTLGELNNFLRFLHLDFLAVAWLGDSRFALLSIIVVNIFQWMGFSMITYYASLMALPDDVYEAAIVDGAGFWRTLFSITIPMLKSTTNVLIILGIVGSLKTFDIVMLLTKGGPGRSTAFLNTYLYENALNNFKGGYAASIGVMILLIALGLSCLQIMLSNNEKRSKI
jgi:raffinose/stachyose/melibiose transport system permease protein